MAKAAKNQELAAGFREHLEQTKGHVERLERVLSTMGQSTSGPKCRGMEGIVTEGAEMIEQEGDDEVKNAGCGPKSRALRNGRLRHGSCLRGNAGRQGRSQTAFANF
jgi:ferritin-like metal-binding protein YciE